MLRQPHAHVQQLCVCTMKFIKNLTSIIACVHAVQRATAAVTSFAPIHSPLRFSPQLFICYAATGHWAPIGRSRSRAKRGDSAERACVHISIIGLCERRTFVSEAIHVKCIRFASLAQLCPLCVCVRLCVCLQPACRLAGQHRR